ncbi:unnamed protein product [Phyllotreta striolata]|uniref:Nucleoporin NUP35 n=1 Tax=Phyllotreta striolata TaxID=444603 RepID=A0A9N9XIW1_PHYSR|nr:unnamed protein product [Phyllotreta striolata]
MEPMHVGSVPSSPASPGINPNFLPGFLMGGDHSNPGSSPGRNRKPSSSEPRSLRQKLFDQSATTDTPTSHRYPAVAQEKTGPPSTGLFDTLDYKNKTKHQQSSPVNSTALYESYGNNSMCIDDNISRITDTPYKKDFTDRIDSYWVTAFGFPPSALTLVLSELSNCGPIADRKVPSQGNWVHVKFNNPNEVSRALSLNCKLLNGTTMIGVVLHHERDHENKENDTLMCSYTSPTRVRSLRHSFVSPGAVNTTQGLPQKSTGVVTKVMEYVFGW